MATKDLIYPPTALGPRGRDRHGSGAFGAPRGTRTHNGLDWETQPYGPVCAPMAGKIVREARAYTMPKGEINTGLEIEGTGEWEGLRLKMFYVSCRWELMGQLVVPRRPIAMALPMRDVYPGITPHVHLQLYRGGGIIDPTPFLEAK